MAKDTKRTEEPRPLETAYALVRKGGVWSMRTYRIKGDTVIGREDSEPDSKAPALGKALVAMERTE